MDTKIILFSYDPNIERVCAAAMRSCYSKYSSYTLFSHTSQSELLENEKVFDNKRAKVMLKKAVEMGHLAVLEHGLFTFDLQGISRACSHQLVRHRMASYSQQSQRHVKITRSYGYLIPPSISKAGRVPILIQGKKLDFNFKDIMDITRQAEENFIKMGINPEDGRYVRPNAAVTNITVSMNPREIMHVLTQRCAPDAQWEIGDIAWGIFACVKLTAPSIFGGLPDSQSIKNKILSLNKIIDRIKTDFNSKKSESLFEIPLTKLGLNHRIRAFVRKI
jgi:thymidylate synthase (FAD)